MQTYIIMLAIMLPLFLITCKYIEFKTSNAIDVSNERNSRAHSTVEYPSTYVAIKT